MSPQIFVSYSHDDEEHKNWVLQLATRLRLNGVDVILDQWNLKLGQDLSSFMEKGLSESQRVICICSENYVEKANNKHSGVGYEKQIMSAELMENLNTDWIIPIITNNNSSNKVPIPNHSAKSITPFSMSKIYKIINTAQSQYKNFFAISFFTGLRTGELVGLKWSDVDIEKREFHIQRSIRKGLETLPKTTSSIRTVEMIDAVIEFFQNQYEITGSKDSYVFLTKTDNSFYDAKTIRAHSWMRTLKEANIEYRPLYQTRHSFASQMIQNGEDIIWVASMLGHSSPKMTLDKYAKYVKSETKKRGTFISNVMCTK